MTRRAGKQQTAIIGAKVQRGIKRLMTQIMALLRSLPRCRASYAFLCSAVNLIAGAKPIHARSLARSLCKGEGASLKTDQPLFIKLHKIWMKRIKKLRISFVFHPL